MNLHNKTFKTLANETGLASDETRFHYYQDNQTITGTYEGGKVNTGNLLGQLIGDQIELFYHCITQDGSLLAGQSKGKVIKNAEGLLEIHLDWKWLNGSQTGGQSKYIEIID